MFVNGVLTGIALGLVLMFLWRRAMRAKRRERYLQAVYHASLGSVKRPEEIEKIIGFFPKWIQFSEFEQVEWLNVQLKELWPYVNKAVQGTIEEVVEPMLDQYEGGAIAHMEFTRTDLGSNAPQIRGVKVHTWEANQVVLDMDMTWQGNCKFKLAITTAARAKVKPCIANLSFTGTIRVILELTNKVPVIAAYVYAINRKPSGEHYTVTFDLSGAGLGAMPGLGGMIDSTIHDTLDTMMLWPRRQAAALIEGYDISHLELQYSGEVIVTVVKAEGLPNMDTMGKSDPRVALYIEKKRQFVTPVKDNDLNPIWKDQIFRIPVDDVLTATLVLRVEDEDVTGWEKMGFATLPLVDVLNKEDETEWTLPLYNSLSSADRVQGDFGKLTIKAIYRSYESEEERKEVTEAEKNWKGTEEAKALAPAEAAAAIQKAKENSKERVQNMQALRGVGQAADKLLNLQKGKLAAVRKAVNAVTAVSSGPSGKESSAAPAAAAPAVPGAPTTTPASTVAIDLPTPPAANPVATGATVAAAVAGAAAQAVAATVEEEVPLSSTVTNESVSATPMFAPPSPAHSHSGAVTPGDEEKHVSRHKVSSFFKGVGHSLGLKGGAAAAEPSGGESPGPERPPTPGSGATPRRSGILSAFKKKAAET